MKSKIAIIILAILIIIVAVYFTISKGFKEEESPNEIKYEVVNMITNLRLGISDFDTIDPYNTKNREILYLDTLIFEPLLTISNDYKIENCLAKEWSKVSETSYIIKIKENIKWSDGTNFTVEDIKNSIQKIQSLKTSIYYENVKDIKLVEIIDKSTIKINLNKESPFFEYNLIFPIVKGDLIGTGKYKVNNISNSKIELTKNENYQNGESPNIKTITVNLYSTMGEVYNAFKLENIDFIHTTNENIQDYIGTMGYEKTEYPGREYDYLAINCTNTILKYNEVRKAINLCLDKNKIVSAILENKAYRADFPIEEKSYLIDSKESYNSLEEAKKVLEDNSWEYKYGIWQKEIDGTTRTLNITLSVSKSNENRLKVAEEIKSEIEALGIKVYIEQISDSKYQSYLKNHNFELLLTGVYTSISPDLTTFFDENNIASYENEEIRSILEELKSITDENLKKEKYNRILEIYLEDIPYIGLYRNKEILAYSNNFRGDVSPNNYNIYYNFSTWYRE